MHSPGVRILSEKISRKMFETLIAGFMHGHIGGLEFVRIFLMENVRNLLENVRNFCSFKKQLSYTLKKQSGQRKSKVRFIFGGTDGLAP